MIKYSKIKCLFLLLMIAATLSSCARVKDGPVCEIYMDHSSYYYTGNKFVYDGENITRASEKRMRPGANNLFTYSEAMESMMNEKPAQFDFMLYGDGFEIAVFHEYGGDNFSFVWIFKDGECQKILLPPRDEGFMNCIINGNELILVGYPYHEEGTDDISLYTVILQIDSGDYTELERSINVTEYFRNASEQDARLWKNSGYYGSAYNLAATDGENLYFLYPTPYDKDGTFRVFSWFFKTDLREPDGETYVKRLDGEGICLAYDNKAVNILTYNDGGREDGFCYSYDTESGTWSQKTACAKDEVFMHRAAAYYDGVFWFAAVMNEGAERSCVYTYEVSTGELKKSKAINGVIEDLKIKIKNGNQYTDAG